MGAITILSISNIRSRFLRHPGLFQHRDHRDSETFPGIEEENGEQTGDGGEQPEEQEAHGIGPDPAGLGI